MGKQDLSLDLDKGILLLFLQSAQERLSQKRHGTQAAKQSCHTTFPNGRFVSRPFLSRKYLVGWGTKLRQINTASFPIQYHEGFYRDILDRNDAALNKFAYCNGFVVGAMCARVEELPGGGHRLYIMTLAVLAAYRGRGIGSELLQSVLDHCQGGCERTGTVPIAKIVLHVQISNADAIHFYTNKFGFSQGDIVENYYRRIDPPHCYVLYKDIVPKKRS
jgi:N-alpha-acetyltransferase 50